MPSTAGGDGAAPDALAAPTPGGPPAEEMQRQRELYAEQAEAAVEAIQAKLAGMRESLATAKAEAKRLRAEAGGNR